LPRHTGAIIPREVCMASFVRLDVVVGARFSHFDKSFTGVAKCWLVCASCWVCSRETRLPRSLARAPNWESCCLAASGAAHLPLGAKTGETPRFPALHSDILFLEQLIKFHLESMQRIRKCLAKSGLQLIRITFSVNHTVRYGYGMSHY
jgi:hypothetical protein